MFFISLHFSCQPQSRQQCLCRRPFSFFFIADEPLASDCTANAGLRVSISPVSHDAPSRGRNTRTLASCSPPGLLHKEFLAIRSPEQNWRSRKHAIPFGKARSKLHWICMSGRNRQRLAAFLLTGSYSTEPVNLRELNPCPGKTSRIFCTQPLFGKRGRHEQEHWVACHPSF